MFLVTEGHYFGGIASSLLCGSGCYFLEGP